MSTTVPESQDIELDNVLQQVFLECDASLSISTIQFTGSTGDEVPISRIIEYAQNQLPVWSIEHLLELQKCLVDVSTNNRVNFRQFKEATKHWIAEVQNAQDGNNNVQAKLYNNRNDAAIEMDMDRDITEIELRMKVRKFDEENITLREELVRFEELVANLERQRNSLEHQVDRYTEKCQQLEKENDEQNDKLNEAIKKEKACTSALQRSKKEYENLLKQLEAAEIEVQIIPFLKNKMDKINKEKTDYMRQIAKLKEQFYEREEEYDSLKIIMVELEDANSSIKEDYESMIRNLREKNRQLADENTELQSWSALNSAPGERLSLSPISDTDGLHAQHSTPYRSEKMPLQNSLYAELKASGFVAECSRNNLLRQELEEELNEYDAVIPTLLEQLEKITQIFATMLNFTDIAEFNPSDAENSRAYNIEALRHKVASVLNMATKEIARRRNVKDSSTQLRTDPVATESLEQLAIPSFWNLLHIHRRQKKTETDLRSIVSQYVNDSEDPFVKVIRANVGVQDQNIIIPIVEELDRIIQNTINSSINYKDHSISGNSRYKSIHTLSSNLQLLQTSTLNTENSMQTSCQSSKTSSFDASFAQGDGPTQEKFAGLNVESHNISDQENLLHSSCSTSVPRDDRSNEITEVSSALQMDPKILPMLEETSSKSFQISEVNGATPTTSPRRKISVYYRTFDVVAVKAPHEDKQGSTLEVRPPLNPSAQDEEKIENNKTMENYNYDRNSGLKYVFDHSYRNTKNDSDSSNSCSPLGKSREDTLLDDELPTVQQISKKIRLAPVRLIFPQKVDSELNKNELLDITDVKDNVSSDTDSSETNTSRTCLSPIVHIDECKKSGDTSAHLSSTSFVDKCETMDDTISQGHPISASLISPKQLDSAKIANSERPHSRTSMQRIGSDNQPCVERPPVGGQMLSREYIAAISGSECELSESGDQCIDGTPITMGANETNRTADAASLISSTSMEMSSEKIMQSNGNAKQKKARHLLVGRSFSEGESGGRTTCRCKQCGDLQTVPLISVENQLTAFPSLVDARLQEFGIANSVDTEIDSKENLTELELQKRYTAFSLCLCTDRITLSRRMEMSLRQRDQSEKNLSYEVRKMQQDIQDTMRQRYSVSGRVTLRRPSFTYEFPKRELEKLDRTNSSNSISELRDISEHIESQRDSEENNNNMLRSNQFDSQNVISHDIVDNETWTNAKQETCPEIFSINENINRDNRRCSRSSHLFRLKSALTSWHIILWTILIFFFGFYVNHAISTMSTCNNTLLSQWSIEEILKRYVQMRRNVSPHPI